jgi:hypothetical protein
MACSCPRLEEPGTIDEWVQQETCLVELSADIAQPYLLGGAMNVYDQLHAIRDELERRQATAATIVVLDRLIALAEPERDNPLAISQAMMLRHLLRQRDVLNNEAVRMDILGLAGDLDEQRPSRRDDDVPDATTDTERRPQHSRSFYKKQKEKERQRH